MASYIGIEKDPRHQGGSLVEHSSPNSMVPIGSPAQVHARPWLLEWSTVCRVKVVNMGLVGNILLRSPKYFIIASDFNQTYFLILDITLCETFKRPLRLGSCAIKVSLQKVKFQIPG